MSEISTYEQLKEQMYSSLEWNGKNSTQGCQLRKRCFSFTEDTITYKTEIIVIGDGQIINIRVDTPIAFEKLYYYLCDVRRFQYLIDGAFYRMNKCDADAVDVTDIVAGIELGYFFNGSYKHKIPLNLTDDEYKYYLSKWCKLQSSLGMIYPMALFANCVNGLPADVRIAMLSECFESLGKSLEDEKKIAVKPEENKLRKAKCTKCNEQFEIPIKGKKTFTCYMRAIVESCGKIIFSSEYPRREDLIRGIVKTRNKVFHVDDKNKGLNGEQCGFYAVKLEWMLRYIIWLKMEFPKDTLDAAIAKEIKAFEKQFPQSIYRNKE